MLVGKVEFSVVDWSAWASGMNTQEQWRQWAREPLLPGGEQMPALGDMPPMQRRRIELLGRMAIQVALWCEGADAGSPLVFASRHGDVGRSLKLLESLVAGQPMSPTAFGLSVHNAIAALHSIVRGHRGNYLALAAGRATAEAACTEAAALLADGAPEVRVVVYDTSLPEIFARFSDEPDSSFAWCWRLAPAGAAGVPLALGWDGDPAPAATPAGGLPHALDVHRFLVSGDPRLDFAGDGCRWSWRRRD